MQNNGDSTDPIVPSAYHWGSDQVDQWITSLGFPQYRDTFSANFITGKKLVLLDASKLSQVSEVIFTRSIITGPKIGVTDFNHIKTIAANIRILLNIREVHSARCISKPRSELNHEYLIRKSQSGHLADRYTMERIVADHEHEGLWAKEVAIKKSAQF